MTSSELKFDSLTNLVSIDHAFVKKIQEHKEYFHRTMECFTEEDSNFRPTPDSLSVAGQVLHAGMAIEFFLSGMFGPYDGFGPLARCDKGFADMGWAQLADEKDLHLVLDPIAWPQAAAAATSIAKALELFDQAMDAAATIFGAKTIQQIQTEQLPENPVFTPDMTYPDIFELMNDHTAHHRGSLVVYAHLLGKDPKIPYFEMSDAMLIAQRLQSAHSQN